MSGNLVIREQRYPTFSGEMPLSYGVFLENCEVIEGLEHWQDCEGIFVCYSWSRAGAMKAIQEIQRL